MVRIEDAKDKFGFSNSSGTNVARYFRTSIYPLAAIDAL